ncbi:L,D-transpeptidase [Saccharomonospora iraqiensis]|uniref:L,D-transpeptidase n=1 Tax=Saccharomonospora iraqiensis TaxID=52698 RepID=UPI00022E0E45|nr:Ig-like domain-containing protein [Saccharomonospora iraqiensis]
MARRGGQLPWRGSRVLSLLVVGVVVAGCGGGAADEGAAPPASSVEAPVSTAPPEPVSLALSVSDDGTGVEPGQPVTVSAEHGRITGGSLVGAHGTKVEHELRTDGALWTTTEPLGYGKTYTLSVEAEGDDGEAVEESATFTTATPARTVGVYINAADGETVGVGMPLIFTFTGDVPDRAAAEEALRVSTEPETEGAFRWFSDRKVIWRPKEYWETGTEVTVDAAIYGKDLGEGTYGAEDEKVGLTIGDKVVAVADGKSHQMKISVNDEKTETFLISMGKPSSSTPNGTYTVMGEHNGYTLDSSTYGVPTDSADGYETWVEYAVRLSNSGIFYHSAPWSVGDQGNRNVSHGCINLAPQDAKWLMDTSKRGDLVTVVNGGDQTLEPTDGWSVWQMSWNEWTSDAS